MCDHNMWDSLAENWVKCITTEKAPRGRPAGQSAHHFRRPDRHGEGLYFTPGVALTEPPQYLVVSTFHV